MLNKPLAFEQDKNAIFLRNKEMYHHYSKLDSIKQRKNTYLPEIPTTKTHINLKKNYSTPSILRDKQYFINRDNKLIYKKLDKINRRANHLNNVSEIIDGYLSVKKFTRDKFREIKNILLNQENIKLKERISHTKPVIDNKILDNEFQKLRKISNCLRKVKQKDSLGSIYINRKESKIIRQYEREKIDFYQKNRDKESKNNDDYLTMRKNYSTSHDNKQFKTSTLNNRVKLPFHIDKKILRKIAYV